MAQARRAPLYSVAEATTRLVAPDYARDGAGRLERIAYARAAALFAAAYPDGPPALDAPPDVWRAASQHPRGYWFNPEAAARPIAFIERYCRHHKGEWAGRRLILERWQRFIVGQVFGWQRADDTRLYRVAYVEVARKNGKTELAAAIALYLTVADYEPGAEVYSAATKRDQAKLAHSAADAMVRASPPLRRWVRSYRNALTCPRNGSKYEPLGADSTTLDGLNPHGAISDELHAHRDRGVRDVLETAMGARRQPLMWDITTAGVYDPNAIGWELHRHAEQVVDGTLDDPEFFAFIAAAEPDDDWTAEATWRKANPNLDVSVKREYLARMCRTAEQRPGFLNTFLRLHLDVWTQQATRWLSIADFNAAGPDCSAAEYEEEAAALVGRSCYGGLDLSTKLDVTALALFFPPAEEDGVWRALHRFYIPEENIAERVRRDRVPYDRWLAEGWLIATPGNVIDYAFIRADILAAADRYRLEQLGYDPWNATQLGVQLLNDDGLPVIEVRQGYASLSEPSKLYETLLRSRRLWHGGHPVLRWMVGNVTVREDPAGNIKPDKSGSKERIDGIIAGVVALACAIRSDESTTVYEDRPPIVLG